jgi:hypothetical protein
MGKSREKKGYQGPKLAGDNSEYRKKRARRNTPDVEKTPNAIFAVSDQDFQEACRKAGVQNTDRQASKWRNGYGAAARAVGRSNRKSP